MYISTKTHLRYAHTKKMRKFQNTFCLLFALKNKLQSRNPKYFSDENWIVRRVTTACLHKTWDRKLECDLDKKHDRRLFEYYFGSNFSFHLVGRV